MDMKEPKLPSKVICGFGLYTKENSDLFIDRDMSPDDLKMIANHIKWYRKKNNIEEKERLAR